MTPELNRVVDANLNRLKEGIRVVEDIARYAQNNQPLSKTLKSLRHQCIVESYTLLVSSRDSDNDVLRPTLTTEMQRSNLVDLIIANYKRAQESSRVLEELFKVLLPSESEKFKTIRYTLYTAEKEHLNLCR
ncbi:MAG: thiamine-phosphate pyrophosphorylase [Campylobacterales bacterium]|nr:thiamine-phosphate pyrophosphorylase [Campylobacterales bacterium]